MTSSVGTDRSSGGPGNSGEKDGVDGRRGWNIGEYRVFYVGGVRTVPWDALEPTGRRWIFPEDGGSRGPSF